MLYSRRVSHKPGEEFVLKCIVGETQLKGHRDGCKSTPVQLTVCVMGSSRESEPLKENYAVFTVPIFALYIPSMFQMWHNYALALVTIVQLTCSIVDHID